jgi:hypothetical protein
MAVTVNKVLFIFIFGIYQFSGPGSRLFCSRLSQDKRNRGQAGQPGGAAAPSYQSPVRVFNARKFVKAP